MKGAIFVTMHELKELKRKRKLTNAQISRLSGVPQGTVNKIFSGETKAPRYQTLQAIADVLEHCNSYQPYDASIEAVIRESTNAYAYSKDGTRTLEDYYSLPDDVRAELIDGTFHYMGAPTSMHQIILGELHIAFYTYIKLRRGPCRVFLSPFDVRLNKDNKTMVQPDLFILCDKSKLDFKCLNGAPDLVVEIVSHGSIKLDYVKKLDKYMEAGVKEYWIVDPLKKIITVYYFQDADVTNRENEGTFAEGDRFFQIYTFSDKIPVQIYDQELEIDFSLIQEAIDEFAK